MTRYGKTGSHLEHAFGQRLSESGREAVFQGDKEIYLPLETDQLEVEMMFEDMIRGWFGGEDVPYNDFIKALLLGNVKAMNRYMNKVALATFSYFDTGKRPSDEIEPELSLIHI